MRETRLARTDKADPTGAPGAAPASAPGAPPISSVTHRYRAGKPRGGAEADLAPPASR